MKRIVKGIVAVMCFLILFGFGSMTMKTQAADANPVQQASDGNWYFYNNGAIDYNYTGVSNNEFGWWYVKNGVVDFNYTGVANNEFGWWYIKNGGVDFNYTGVANNEFGWWYIKNGGVDFSYTGVANNEFGWWYIKNGGVDFSYTGVANNEFGWWYICNGGVDFNYTGLAQNEFGWWYINKGGVDFNFTGLCANFAGLWYCKDGQVRFDYTGSYTYNGKQYDVKGGLATEKTVKKTGWVKEDGKMHYYNQNGQLEQAKGIDVSYYQGKIDWDAVKASDVKFAIIRIGYGDNATNQDDSLATYNLNECERLGIPYGVYMLSYAMDDSDGTAEVHAQSEIEHMERMLQGRNPQLGVFLDIEAASYKNIKNFDPYSAAGRKKVTSIAKMIMDGFTKAGYTAGIYANQDYFNKVLIQSELADYKWIATTDQDVCPSGNWVMWQYSKTGKILRKEYSSEADKYADVDLDLWLNN